MKKSVKTCLQAGVHLFACCLLMVLAAGIFLLDVHSTPEAGKYFSESSYTEGSQVVVLVLSGLFFALGAYLNRARYVPAALLTGMALLGAVRELDGYFDRFRHGFWKVPAAVVVLVALASIWKRRKTLFDAFAHEVKRTYWGTLCAGFSLVFIFSRLFGMRHNWETLMGQGPTTINIRRLAEEGTELAGYMLILVAATGFLISCLTERRQRKAAEIAE